MNLSYNSDVRQLSGQSSAATFTSTAINLGGSEGCMFLVSLSTAGESAAGITASLTGSTALAGSYVAYGPGVNLTGTTGATKNERCLVLDISKPLKQYAKVVVAGGSSGTRYLTGITAVRYGLRYPGSSDRMGSTTVSSTQPIISPTSS